MGGWSVFHAEQSHAGATLPRNGRPGSGGDGGGTHRKEQRHSNSDTGGRRARSVGGGGVGTTARLVVAGRAEIRGEVPARRAGRRGEVCIRGVGRGGFETRPRVRIATAVRLGVAVGAGFTARRVDARRYSGRRRPTGAASGAVPQTRHAAAPGDHPTGGVPTDGRRRWVGQSNNLRDGAAHVGRPICAFRGGDSGKSGRQQAKKWVAITVDASGDKQRSGWR